LARQQLLFGRFVPVEEQIAKIDAVSVDDILQSAQKVFASKPTYALVGNIDGHIDYDTICTKLK